MELQPRLLRTADTLRSGLDDRALRRRAERGELQRLAPGTYLDAGLWRSLAARERYIARIQAIVARLSGPVVISHWSAAALWGFPVPDEWPVRVHVIDRRRSGSQLTPTLHRRAGEILPTDVASWEGLALTSPSRTAADIALSSPFSHAVLVLDHGLHTGGFARDHVAEQLARRPGAQRRKSAAAALAFADSRAEFAGESFSRVGMAERGILSPTLQEPFRDQGGLVGCTDFWWESVGVAGEFDGDWKYSDERWLRGRTAAEAIRDEKRRQARLAVLPRVNQIVRWDYPVARNPIELARRLLAAGVPRSDAFARPPRSP
ncbi:hypothetical protein AX769_15560 [Frondihabitans sp. PAMC 28766]|uniref:type IV toxin-antitoxin system AbiEi family antitoxin domain-containing protein n=1 Tax=Frondihabitans sp. PAMC 28766 TaxID=1795630 RepID=UPI00078BA26C|nr:type IV toxin-antitoxin system AbiEi family antitoxin domain-containing protein [Frondihabitans sp. PAMC 28766]AMM21289.1 hypothetical protein AX769_15560 [Frondihabitans sp. PAMC 28766]